MRVCSLHFSDSCYERDLRNELLGIPVRKRLLPDAVPTQFVVESKLSNSNCTADITLKMPISINT